MPAVHHVTSPVATVAADWLSRLKADAETAPLRRARLCLHRDDQAAVHEMLIVFCQDSLVPVHRHTDKSESFHVIEGELLVVLFSDDGEPADFIHLGPLGSGLPFLYRIDAPIWHTVIPLTPFAAIHEVTKGPFITGDADAPSWAPQDQNGLRAFFDALTEKSSWKSIPS